MKIVEGTIPEEKRWRVLVMLSAGRTLGIAWQLGSALARSHRGDLVTAVIISSEDESHLEAARKQIAQVREIISDDGRLLPLIVQAEDYDRGIIELVKRLGVDLFLTHADNPERPSLKNIPCTIGIMRGDITPDEQETTVGEKIKKIVVPTSAGPNTEHALSFLLPLTPVIEIEAIYIVPTHLGPNEEALGRSRLRQLLNIIDAGDRIKTKIITSPSVADGIVDAASGDCDLVVIGASRESSIDKVLFGDIPGAVVRQSHTPIMIVQQPRSRLDNIIGTLLWRLENLRIRLNLKQRAEVYARIRRSARPDTEFFILIALSAMIAALGLVINSPAVVIGAMLVAPLMSPIVGGGLAIVLGDTRFLRLSLGAVIRGVFLAVVVGALAGLVNLNGPLTAELLARTQPTLIDLAIALFSGMAGAYALSHSDAAGALPGVAIAAALVPPLSATGILLTMGEYQESFGAFLLFTTNYVAISSATALTFLILGFRPTPSQKAQREVQARSVRVSLLLVVIVALLLTVFTIRLAQDANKITVTRDIVRQSVTEVTGARIVSPDDLIIHGDIVDGDVPLEMDLTVRSTNNIPFSKVEELQDSIGIALQREVGLTLTVIRVTDLDPEVPPTQTPTPPPTETFTPGPTPTATPTDTPTPLPTNTPIATPTDTPTPDITVTATPPPTETAVPTPTPQKAVITSPYGLNLRSEPGLEAEILTFLAEEAVVIMLDRQEISDGLLWQWVEYDGQRGWVSVLFLAPTE